MASDQDFRPPHRRRKRLHLAIPIHFEVEATDALREVMRRSGRHATIGLLWIGGSFCLHHHRAVVAIFAPLIAPFDPVRAQDLTRRLIQPGVE